jgi:hypothetical protein
MLQHLGSAKRVVALKIKTGHVFTKQTNEITNSVIAETKKILGYTTDMSPMNFVVSPPGCGPSVTNF